MIAASMWSLLIPAIEEAEAMGMVGWVPAAGGSVLGIAFLLTMDALLPQLTPESFRHLGRRTPLLVLAVTLHNIPEGMAVGISFALASQGDTPAQLTAAVALALLSCAAGAMLYVVVEELIPGAHLEDHSSRGGTLGVMAGFLLMMILDVALG